MGEEFGDEQDDGDGSVLSPGRFFPSGATKLLDTHLLISFPFPATLRQGFKGKEFDLNAGDEEKLDMVIPSKQVRHLSHSLKSALFLTMLELLLFRVGIILSLCKPARPTNISLRFVVTTSQFLLASIQPTSPTCLAEPWPYSGARLGINLRTITRPKV